MDSRSTNDPQSTPVALNCPSCGAALPAGEGRVECSYCGTIVLVSKPKPAERAPKPGEPSDGVVWGTPTVTIIQKRRVAPAPKQQGGCVVGAIIIVVVGGIILSVLAASGLFAGIAFLNNTPLQSRLYGSRGVTVLTPDKAPPQIIAFVHGGEENKERLALLDLATNKRIWVGPALSDDAYASAPIGFTDDTIVYPDNRTLIGFSRADGTQRWTSNLTDRVCDKCLVIVGKAVVVMAADFVVQGYDLASGERLWTSDVVGDYGLRELRVAGDQVLVYGRNADVDGQISLLDPTTGKVIQQFTPECKLDAFSEDVFYTNPDTTQWLSPDGKTLVLYADYTKPCVLAYDPTTGNKLWQAILEYPDSGLSLDKTITAGDTAFFVGARGRIYKTERESGETIELFANEDYAFHTLAERDGVLMAVAVKQRGTRIGELWGIDTSSGKRIWQRSFKGDGEMFSEPYNASGTVSDNEEIWDQSNTSKGFALIRLASKPHHYTIEILDTKTGQASSTQTIDRGGDDTVWVPDISARVGDQLIMNESTTLVVIDLVAGKIVYEGP